MPNWSAKSRWTPTTCWLISTLRTRSPNCARRSSRPRLNRRSGTSASRRHAGQRSTKPLPLGVVHQIGGEIGRLQLQIDPVAVAGERARDDDVVLDRGGGQPKHAEGALQLRIDVRVDHLFLALEPVERLFLS